MKSPLKYFGGKSQISGWLLSNFPAEYKTYGEVFAGGLSVLFSANHKNKIEVANDIWGELTNFYRVLQSETLYREFQRLCDLTPRSQVEFEAANSEILRNMETFGDNILSAWHFFIRNRMSFSGTGQSYAPTTSRTRRGMNENVSSWLSAVDSLPEFHERLRMVEIRKMDFRDFIKEYDSPDTFFYLDPPYLAETRSAGKYDHEISDGDHIALLGILTRIEGKFLLSGYPSDLYSRWAEAYGFFSESLEVTKSSSTKKTEKPKGVETIWRNYDRVATSL